MRRHSSSRRAPARAHREDARERARGGVQGLVNWGPRLSPERSASVSQIAGMVAIQTQAIFSIEGHDRKFPTRVLFCSTPSLFEVAGCESALSFLARPDAHIAPARPVLRGVAAKSPHQVGGGASGHRARGPSARHIADGRRGKGVGAAKSYEPVHVVRFDSCCSASRCWRSRLLRARRLPSIPTGAPLSRAAPSHAGLARAVSGRGAPAARCSTPTR